MKDTEKDALPEQRAFNITEKSNYAPSGADRLHARRKPRQFARDRIGVHNTLGCSALHFRLRRAKRFLRRRLVARLYCFFHLAQKATDA
jgi:hypothetical protein